MRTLLLLAAIAPAVSAGQPDTPRWTLRAPVLEPGAVGSFDETAVKDPTVVFFEGRWHVFYTARGRGEYTTGYVAAETLAGLAKAPRHELKQVRGRGRRYACAPQVFFFRPQQKWYLLFQTRDANYQPAYSTTPTIGNPASWSTPAPLIAKDERAKWIDFWVICDADNACLFYTRVHRDVIVRTAPLGKFPRGWSAGKKALGGVHEAVHVYRVAGRDAYHMIFERNRGGPGAGERAFGFATAPALTGPWMVVTERYAIGGALVPAAGVARWTDVVSHGEAIRSGCDQRLEYDPRGCRWLIQGLAKEQNRGPYPALPWRLGLIQMRAEK